MRPLPAKSTSREMLEKAVEAGVGLIPVAGGPAAAALQYALGRAHARRTDQWLNELADHVTQLMAGGEDISVEDLVADERFVDAVVTATRAAQRTHQQEKITALRNAVFSSVLPGAPDTDTQMIFFRWIDDFTVGHLQLLTLLNDPRAWYTRRGLRIRDDMLSGSRRQVVEDGIPEFAGRRDFTDVLVRDLNAAGLINSGLDGMATAAGVYQSATTSMGRAFIAFITARDHR